MKKVKAKKYLGQHFLNDEAIAEKIALALQSTSEYKHILEIGPGMGVMTKYLITDYPKHNLEVVELDTESVDFLNENYPKLRVHSANFLQLDLSNLFGGDQFALTGNYPYNISTQIIFKALENRAHIPEIAGMFQKEVAERFCANHGSKTYGITSVLTQAFYDAEYLFTVDENVFTPPPKVKSGVLRLTRRQQEPDCNVKLLFQVVKLVFNQRRKTIRNGLKSLVDIHAVAPEMARMRPEQISVQDFIALTNKISAVLD